MIKLMSVCTDTGTDTVGMVTHYCFGLNNHRMYLFQPRGINPETRHPLRTRMVPEARLIGGTLCDDDKNVPIQILGTEVEYIPSSIKGMATELVMHPTGCLHVMIQQKGVLPKTGQTIEPFNADIILISSPLLTQLTEEQKQQQMKEKPSPTAAFSMETNYEASFN